MKAALRRSSARDTRTGQVEYAVAVIFRECEGNLIFSLEGQQVCETFLRDEARASIVPNQDHSCEG